MMLRWFKRLLRKRQAKYYTEQGLDGVFLLREQVTYRIICAVDTNYNVLALVRGREDVNQRLREAAASIGYTCAEHGVDDLIYITVVGYGAFVKRRLTA